MSAGETKASGYRPASRHVLRFFRWYIRRHLRRHFAGVLLLGELPELSEERPVVVFSAHPSWWDPLVFMFLHEMAFGWRAQAGPIDAGQLAKFPIFGKLGLFGIEPGTAAGAREFLRCSREHFRERGAVLWVTPQGRFADVRERPLGLAGGVEMLARREPEALLVPLALEYCFWNERLPYVLVHFGESVEAGGMEAGLEAAMDRLGAAARRREGGEFRCLLRGKSGTGGVYDWRRE